MEIKTLGLTGLLVKTKHSTIIIDPLSKDTGAKGMPNKADIVCVSRPGSAYCDVSRIKETYLIDKPGEYEVGGVMVFARPIVQGGELGIVYQVFIDDIAILHLGGLKKKPKNGLLEELNLVDILVVPVGGMFSLDAKTAKAITVALEPAYVIPVNYKEKGMIAELESGLASVEDFTKEMQVKSVEVEKKFKIAKTQLKTDDAIKTSVVLLDSVCFGN